MSFSAQKYCGDKDVSKVIGKLPEAGWACKRGRVHERQYARSA